ncbi:MAG: family 1 glycosylhydrolase [Saprospiraceae bacterium]|nr:family 1 glycosylhydrolase [Saprospiraceae bacterium]
MRIEFPSHFFWGSSTAAAQVETASDHQWKGLKAADGHVFQRTTDHEKRRSEDADLIARFGSIYRCGVDWSRLQHAPFEKFDPQVVQEYRDFFELLQKKEVGIMLVLHHFAHPTWFEKKGAWESEDNIPMYLDFTRQCIKHFGSYVSYWNTFNEPNVYAMNAYLLGNFPPRKKGRYFIANRVLKHMGRAHEIAFSMIREKSEAPIGISLNTAWFEGTNLLGSAVALFVRWWFMHRAAEPFRKCDFWGLSFYAYMLFDPFPIDAINGRQKLEKMQIPHDRMWGYRPDRLLSVLRYFNNRYQKPIIITENGVCTNDQAFRIQAIKQYLHVCHQAIQESIDLRGYIHWSTWDNFEWHLGPTYRFGLVHVDFETMNRSMTEAGLFYERIIKENALNI